MKRRSPCARASWQPATFSARAPRGYTRVLRVARTIADLDGAERVERDAVAEALRFRGEG